MIMAPRLRKFVLAAHIALAVGWIGAVAGYIALDVVAATSQDAQTLRAAYLAMELITWYVIVPLALTSLLTVAADRACHVPGDAVGLVPALLGSDLTPADHNRHYRLSGGNADDQLLRSHSSGSDNVQ
jgi:hypothetical protein